MVHRLNISFSPCTQITRHCSNAGLMLAQRLRRWSNINLTLDQFLVFAGINSDLFLIIDPQMCLLLHVSNFYHNEWLMYIEKTVCECGFPVFWD